MCNNFDTFLDKNQYFLRFAAVRKHFALCQYWVFTGLKHWILIIHCLSPGFATPLNRSIHNKLNKNSPYSWAIAVKFNIKVSQIVLLDYSAVQYLLKSPLKVTTRRGKQLRIEDHDHICPLFSLLNQFLFKYVIVILMFY